MDRDGAALAASTASIQAYHDIIDTYLLQAILSSTLCGISLVLSLVSLSVLYMRGIKQRSVQVLLVATTVMTLSTILFHAATIVSSFVMNKLLAVQFSGSSLDSDEYAFLIRILYAMDMIGTSTLFINILLGDAVVVWRAVALWNYNKIVRIGGMVMVALIALSGVLSVVWSAPANLELVKYTVDPASFHGISQAARNAPAFSFAAQIMTLVSNVFATALITYKAWSHWQTILRSLSGRHALPRALRCLLLLVETGFAYSLLWLYVTVVFGMIDIPPHANLSEFETAGAVFMASCLVPIVAIYPMAIIVIFAMKQSSLEPPPVLTTIPFDTAMSLSMSVFQDSHGKTGSTDQSTGSRSHPATGVDFGAVLSVHATAQEGVRHTA